MKYPRTLHLPWSAGGTADDIRLTDIDILKKIPNVIFTEKLDGENTVMSRESIHARSEEGYNKPWQTFTKGHWNTFKLDIPENMLICGENLYAIHSIEYTKLSSYFYVFGIIYNDYFISWDETKEWCNLLNLSIVPVIKQGSFELLDIPKESQLGGLCEGYVVRNTDKFKVGEFQLNVAKCVREKHVQTDIHWTKTWKKANLI